MNYIDILETVIRLGSKNPRLAEFMADYRDATEEHPFDRTARIYKNATIQVSSFNNAIHISDIRSLNPGGGREALALLCGLADKHRLRLTLTAKAYDDKGLSTAQLQKWYLRHGFYNDSDSYGDDFEGYDMIRDPR